MDDLGRVRNDLEAENRAVEPHRSVKIADIEVYVRKSSGPWHLSSPFHNLLLLTIDLKLSVGLLAHLYLGCYAADVTGDRRRDQAISTERVYGTRFEDKVVSVILGYRKALGIPKLDMSKETER